MIEKKPDINIKRQSLWERCTFDNILISIIFIGGGAMLILAVILFVNVLLMLRGESEDLYESVRNLILSMGGVGAAIGLWFADRRQKVFLKQVDEQSKQVHALSKQVQVQVEQVNVQSKQVQVLSEQVKVQADQSFNERLGRGVELLGKEDVSIRSAGVRVLVDLANSTTEAQKSLVANIIYDFFCDKASARHDENNKRLPPVEARRQDLQNALDFLIGLSLNERKKLLPNQINNDKLKLTHLDFSHLNFSSRILKNINFSASYLCEINFEKKAIIENVNFFLARIEFLMLEAAEIRNSNFLSVKITNSWFISCAFEKSNFTNATIEQTSFLDVKIADSEFGRVQFIGGRFAGKVNLSSKDNLPKFICTEFWHTEFDSPDEINSDDIFELCYYHKDVQITFNLNKNRGYISTLGMNVFVESDKPWSGQPVEARIALEIAEWKLEQTRETSTDIDKQKKDIAALANELKAAEAQLQRRRDKFNNP